MLIVYLLSLVVIITSDQTIIVSSAEPPQNPEELRVRNGFANASGNNN